MASSSCRWRRSALGWFRDHDPPAALRLAAAMAAFWSLRGHHTEGRQRLDELLGLVEDPSVARVSALSGAAWLAIDQGDYPRAADLLAESIGLSQALGDPVGEAIATAYQGRCKLSSLLIEAARPDVERAVALATEAGDREAIAFTMFYSGLVALLTGELEAACDLFTRCAAMAAGLGLAPLSARARQMLAFPLLDLGELVAARAALADTFPVCLEVGDRWVIQIGLAGLVRPDGHVAAKGGPGRMPAISGYLRGLFGEPGSVPSAMPTGAPAAPAAATRGQ